MVLKLIPTSLVQPMIVAMEDLAAALGGSAGSEADDQN